MCSCLPCAPWLSPCGISRAGSPDRRPLLRHQDNRLDQADDVACPVGLHALNEPLLEALLDFMSSDSLARLAGTSKAYQSPGHTARLGFQWGNGEDTVTGDAGWLVELGVTLPVQVDVYRLWWAFEICKLEGLLSIGVADRRMKDNAFLGAQSGGQWDAWGWELTKNGLLQSVSARTTVAQHIPLPADVRPSKERRIVLLLHLDCQHARLELFLRVPGSSLAASTCELIDSVALTSLVDPPKALRPVVCVNIGAAIRISQ